MSHKEYVNSDNFKFIGSPDDLPNPSVGVINIPTGWTLYLANNVDLLGDRIVCDGVASIIGSSPEVAGLSSTGLSASTALITSEFTLSLNNIDLDHPTTLDLDATANADQALDWYGVNFSDNTTSIGTIKNYSNCIFNVIGFLNSGGLTFDGTFGTIAFTSTIFQNAATLTSIIVPATATINTRIRVSDSSFVSLTGETALDISTSASIPDEGYILNNVNFDGNGTFLTGVQDSDNKARFTGCRGINNSASIAQYYMQGNETATTITTQDVFVKIAGTTTAGDFVEKFDVTTTDNKAVYTGSLTGFFKIEAVTAASSGNNKTLFIVIYKNGVVVTPSRSKGTTSGNGKADNIVCQDVIELETDDYIEIFVAQGNGTTDITAEEMNVTIVHVS